jgi:hypothetical protein
VLARALRRNPSWILIEGPDDRLGASLSSVREIEIAIDPYVRSTFTSFKSERPLLVRSPPLHLVHSNLLNAAQMTPQLYSAGEETLKIIFAYVPMLAEFECRQLSTASHAFDFLATAFEELRHISHVQHRFVSQFGTVNEMAT